MKFLSLCVLLLYLMCQVSGETQYTTKYDSINLDEILASERLLTGYIKCLLDEGPCTPDGKELKGNLPDAMQNDCDKCTPKQREGADQVMHYIIDHRSDDWHKLEEKYKSDGTYKRKYLESKKKSEDNETAKAEDQDNESKTSSESYD